jgi:hypothetical protein
MAIDGNLESGQEIKMATPTIKVGGVELSGGLQVQDERLSYYRDHKNATAPAIITVTSTDTNVHLRYTFNGRTPTSKSAEYTGPITLYQNSSGNLTVFKVRAFKYQNSNHVSLIVKGRINVLGGNTFE